MQQSESNELYPELIDYIYSYGGKFMTDAEAMAARAIIYNSKGLQPKMLDFIKSKGWFSDDENIRAMIADGFDAFKRRMVTRIYAQHKTELNLNLCPNCKKIARTPLAKQCRFCLFDWH